METTKTFSKTFTGQYTPRGYFSSIEVEIEVDFIGIETQAELDQIIDDGECYDYKVVNITSWDANEGEWLDHTEDMLYPVKAAKIDTLISDKLYDEQARKNG